MTKTAQLTFDGKTIELPIIEGTQGDKAIDITRLRAQTGLITYDPGYMTAASSSLLVVRARMPV